MQTWASVWHLLRVECWSKCITNLSFTRDDQIQRWCALISLHHTMCLWEICDISSWVTVTFMSNQIEGKITVFLNTKKSNSLAKGEPSPLVGSQKSSADLVRTLWPIPKVRSLNHNARPFWLISSRQKNDLKSANEYWRTYHVFNTQTSNTTTAQAWIHYYFFSFYLMAQPQVLLAHWCEVLRCDQTSEHARAPGCRDIRHFTESFQSHTAPKKMHH